MATSIFKTPTIQPLVTLPPSEPKEPPAKAPRKAPEPARELRNGVMQKAQQGKVSRATASEIEAYRETGASEQDVTRFANETDTERRRRILAGDIRTLDLSIGGTGGVGLLGRAAEVYQREALEPLAARATYGAQKVIPGTQEIEEKTDRGVNVTDAYRSTKLPKFVKGALELVIDPANLLFGAGIGSKGAKASATASRSLAREGVEMGVRQNEPLTAVQKLTSLIKQAQPVRETTEALKSAELGKRVGSFRTVAGQGEAEGSFRRATSQLAGELPKADFNPIRPNLLPKDVDELYSINRSRWLQTGQPLNGLNTETALTKVLTGELPTEGEISLLEETFGMDLAKALLGKRALPDKIRQEFMGALNLPRSFVASADLSAPLRQGIMLAGGHPKEWFGSLAPMVKAFGSEQAAKVVDDAIVSSKRFALAEKANLYKAPLGAAAKLSEREEAYMTRFGKAFPWVRWSERAYVTFLNKLRFDTFDNVVAGWERSGKKFTNRDVTDLADFINKASGRGTFGKAGNDLAPVLNAAFFSPRLVASRIQAPAKLLSASPEVRKTIIKDLAAFVGAGSSALGLIAHYSDADVNLDPRSSDFGKLRVGPTRYDFWGGEQQIARFVTQMITGKRQAISTGELQDTSRKDTALRFARSKLAPVPSLLTDYLTGETFFGAPIDEEAKAEFARTVTPILIQDMWEAIDEQGLTGGLVTLPSALGAGVQTFYPTGDTFEDEERQKLVGEIPEKGINIKREEALRQSTPKERREFREANPDSAEAIDERKLKESSGASRAVLEIKLGRLAEEQALEQEVATGKISLTQYAERYRNIQEQAAIRSDQASKDEFGDEEPRDPLKKAVWQYYQVFKGAKLPGGLDFERVDVELADLERQWTPEQKQFVADSTGQTEHRSEVARAYEADKDVIKQAQYWDAHMEIPQLLQYPDLAEFYNDYRRLDNDQAFELKYGKKRLKQMKDIRSETTRIRKEKRLADPVLDAALVKWYGYTPETDLGKKWEQRLDRQLAGVK